ncbi:MAG TPA: DUF3883 domain-containing protein, partial [Chitinophagaceae bacterium]|nr:DUF3883 domain-containing protein [Chitinophagaceae bacterium]
GYVEPWGSININNLDDGVEGDLIKGVTIVWTATRPTGGRYIIGWYKDASLFRYCQEAPNNSKRFHKGKLLGYYAVSKISNSRLLTIDERIVRVPSGKNGFGEKNIWYCKKNPKFLQLISDYIFKGIIPKSIKRNKVKGRRQADPLKRLQIELKAVRLVIRHYTKQGYSITSVERDNVGWDLTAIHNDIELKLEVKGLSGNIVNLELTANEFAQLKKHKNGYRLCVVTETLVKPRLRIFSYCADVDAWLDNYDSPLTFEKIVSARAKVI